MRTLLIANVLVPPHMAVWQAVARAGVDISIVGSVASYGNRMYAPGPYAPPPGIRTHVVTPMGRRNAGHQQWVYPQLGHIENIERPDLLHVISEPWGLLAGQVSYHTTPYVVHASTDIAPAGYGPERFLKWAIQKRVLRGAAGFAAPNRGAISQARLAGLPLSVPAALAQHLVPDPAPFLAARLRRTELRAQYGWRLDDLVIGFAGRLEKQKGIHWLVDAVSQVPGSPLLAIAGWGSQEAAVRSRVREQGISLALLATLRSDAIAEFLASIDILVVPSLTTPTWKEYFGRIAVEAMLTGTTLVVSDSGYLPSVVPPEVPVVVGGDVAALAAVLTELAENADLRRAISQAGLRHANSRHTPDAVADVIVSLWKSIL